MDSLGEGALEAVAVTGPTSARAGRLSAPAIEGAGRVSQVPRRATRIVERVVVLTRPTIATAAPASEMRGAAIAMARAFRLRLEPTSWIAGRAIAPVWRAAPASARAIETSGRAIETSGRAIETSGRAIKTSGRAIETSGRAIETSGRAIETSGRVIETSGRAIETSGRAIGTSGPAIGTSGPAIKTSGRVIEVACDCR